MNSSDNLDDLEILGKSFAKLLFGALWLDTQKIVEKAIVLHNLILYKYLPALKDVISFSAHKIWSKYSYINSLIEYLKANQKSKSFSPCHVQILKQKKRPD